MEAAYDVLLMDSLNRRQAGKIDPTIRFADVQKPAPPRVVGQMPDWVPKVATPAINVPASGDIAVTAAIFGALGAWSLLEDTLQPTGTPTVPGLQLALGYGAAVYFLREKRKQKMGRANLLAVLGLAVGAAIGGIMEGWLRVDIVPIGGLDSGPVLVSEFVFVALWIASTFLD